MQTTATQNKKPNREAPFCSSNTSKHKMDCESIKRQYEMIFIQLIETRGETYVNQSYALHKAKQRCTILDLKFE